jgi:hypothetical protein
VASLESRRQFTEHLWSRRAGDRVPLDGGRDSNPSTIAEVEPQRRIGWTGRAPLGIRAVHTWSFEADGDGTRVRTEESLDGLMTRLLAGLMRRVLDRALQRGVAALKAEAERRNNPAGPVADRVNESTTERSSR